jgi:hypothetical protein
VNSTHHQFFILSFLSHVQMRMRRLLSSTSESGVSPRDRKRASRDRIVAGAASESARDQKRASRDRIVAGAASVSARDRKRASRDRIVAGAASESARDQKRASHDRTMAAASESARDQKRSSRDRAMAGEASGFARDRHPSFHGPDDARAEVKAAIEAAVAVAEENVVVKRRRFVENSTGSCVGEGKAKDASGGCAPPVERRCSRATMLFGFESEAEVVEIDKGRRAGALLVFPNTIATLGAPCDAARHPDHVGISTNKVLFHLQINLLHFFFVASEFSSYVSF